MKLYLCRYRLEITIQEESNTIGYDLEIKPHCYYCQAQFQLAIQASAELRLAILSVVWFVYI